MNHRNRFRATHIPAELDLAGVGLEYLEMDPFRDGGVPRRADSPLPPQARVDL